MQTGKLHSATGPKYTPNSFQTDCYQVRVQPVSMQEQDILLKECIKVKPMIVVEQR